jgi:tRNA dimethylallyltransferase
VSRINRNIRAVAIVGATASGKSDLAMAAAQAAGSTEIVAVDAMQVYRGMDIGTAKPSLADRALVPHHGIDLVDPDASFTVADFQHVADAALGDIARRGRTPLLVAGTGLYLAALVNELDLPGSWPVIRARLEEEPDTSALFARLRTGDPMAAARMEPTNRRRIIRALEVIEGSGRPFSSFGPGLETYPDSPIVQVGLRWPRERLADRIELRVEQMMDRGLLDEVRGLLERCVLSRTAAQALGYKELIDHLQGECSLDEAVSTIVVRTRQFAARQDRWFRRDPRIRWVDLEHDPMEALSVVLGALST